MALRAANPDDLLQVEALVRAAYTPWIARINATPGPLNDDYADAIAQGLVQVFEADRGVEALLVLIPQPDALLLDNLAVHPDAQGKGHGTYLMGVAAQAAISQGFDRIRLYTHEGMAANIRLYQRHGYAITHRVTERGLNRVYMEKRLSQPDT
ncbi:GNAT family N-acetyltransferase [Gymnodinialimonas sp. 57CJ19]|uniref:GNAT family N-acetyltransferase n=1 Tax=Gymnodinialimonas sp. 57CJ19 TaxID=3138498 RepID=UPI0031344E62